VRIVSGNVHHIHILHVLTFRHVYNFVPNRSVHNSEGGIGEWERVLRTKIGKMQGLVSDRALPVCLECIMIAIPDESQHQCAEAAAAALDEMLKLRSALRVTILRVFGARAQADLLFFCSPQGAL
jgi:hypothetical protein